MVRALSVVLALAGCAYPYTPPALTPVTQPAPPAGGSPTLGVRDPVIILVSIDGFRPDYLDRGVTPNLSRLAAEGVLAAMRPSFPTKTFPNHWTLVTGKHPDGHGIVANSFEDPRRPGETFTMASDDPFWWNAAEPIWVTAERAGIRTATMFWPGANVAWGGARATEWPNRIAGGTRPRDWHQFAQAVPNDQRVRSVLDWLARDAATRPRFLTLYFDTVDTAGHEFGPDDPRTTQAVAEIDARVGDLTAGLARLGQPANLVVVADHGMATTSSARTVAMEAIVPPTEARLIETGPVVGVVPLPGREAAVAAAILKPHPRMTCRRRTELPARLRYGANPRVPPYLCMAELGWTIAKTAPTRAYTGGNHGYDNAAPEMRALFVANGPAFAAGRRIERVDSVDVAPLLRRLLGLPTGEGLDGDAAAFQSALRNR